MRADNNHYSAASTGDHVFAPSDPLFGHFEGVGLVGVQGEQIGRNAEEGIEEGSKRGRGGSNGSQIEMQEMNRDDAH